MNQEKQNFTAFVLLNNTEFNFTQFKELLEENYNITLSEENFNSDGILFYHSNMLVTLSFINKPIPNQEAEYYAGFNFMWKEAIQETKKHKSHLLVAVLSTNENKIEEAKLFTKINACCLQMPNAIGLYNGATVLQPSFYLENAKMLEENRLPIYNWIYISVYPCENGVNAYTYGMYLFDKFELEICQSQREDKEIFFLLYDIVAHILTYDLDLEKITKLKFDDGNEFQLEKSKGISVEGESLKIIL